LIASGGVGGETVLFSLAYVLGGYRGVQPLPIPPLDGVEAWRFLFQRARGANGSRR
jgi:hypothetical protein